MGVLMDINDLFFKNGYEEGVKSMIPEIRRLRSILARVHNELHDPMSKNWCDRPEEDRDLLVNLRNYVDEEMEMSIGGPDD